MINNLKNSNNDNDLIIIIRYNLKKVRAWYYYKRAGWYVVETRLKYPDEPLPDPETLKKNFNRCITDGSSGIN